MIVSDTSSLNYLILVEEADILAKLYEAVLIPQSVYEELHAPRTPAAVRTWIDNPPPWLRVSSALLEPVGGLQSLHSGERDALALALHVRAKALIIDERYGREEAEKRRINVIGTLGVLAAAHEVGLLDLAQAVCRLRQTTFHVSPRLLAAVLQKYQIPAREEE
jgi:predicted nucleic acid-binding protein